MTALRKEQLDFLTPWDFIIHQVVDNGMGLFIWLPGLVFLLFSPGLKKFQFIGFAFILTFAFYLIMKGKNYYLFGAYPMLFAVGATALEGWLQTSSYALKALLVAAFTLPNLLVLPIALPILSLNQTIAILSVGRKNLPFLNFTIIWEDHKMHPISQNYGDMLGWEELTAKVAQAWQSLTPEQQRHTQIYADNYGEAGAINHFGKQYNLPVVISLNSSFALWAPDNLDGDYIIYVDEQGGKNVKKLQLNPESYHKTADVENPLSIEKGTAIFLLVHPAQVVNELYKKELAEKRLQ